MVTIAIWGDNRILGINCARGMYGTEKVDKVLWGYLYHGLNGHHIVRMTQGEVSRWSKCDKCKQALEVCNAAEVRVKR